jgi:ABC-type branched-subunit amino acid transport system substrate-binding protein
MTSRTWICSLSLLALGACGPKVAPQPWIEREAQTSRPLGEHHETQGDGTTVQPTGPKIDVTKLDAETADERTVLAALAQVGDRAPAAALALRAARLAHHRGDDAEARALLARAVTAADEPRVHAALAALAAELAEPPVDTATIAVLLPLSGRYAALGSELRAAIELAPAQGTRWLFLDTRGEPDGAAAAVATARAKGVVALLGPVGTREALSAARAASLAEIPIALLAPGDGADASAGVFRLVTSPGDEARAVARLAHDDSFPTVAVFAPRDDVGGEAADAFVAEAQRLGLQVTARGSYDPTGGDLEPDVKQLLDLVPVHNPRLAEHLQKDPKHGWQTFSPDIPFSLLYIPDRYDRAAIVAAFLPYFNVELRTTEFPDPARLARKHHGRIPQVVQLVGGAGWHHVSLPTRGGTAVQGALIVDDCETGSDTAAHFASDFQAKVGHPPSSAAAQAFDAATLVASARATSPSRAGVRAALAHGKLDDGGCGPAALGPDGELTRAPSILEVSGDEFIPAP